MHQNLENLLKQVVHLRAQREELEAQKKLLTTDLMDRLVSRNMLVEDRKQVLRYQTPTHNITYVRESLSRVFKQPLEKGLLDTIRAEKNTSMPAVEVLLLACDFDLAKMDGALADGRLTQEAYNSLFAKMPEIRKNLVVYGPDGRDLFGDVSTEDSYEDEKEDQHND